MANSASDARASELEIRKALIESGAVDVMIAIGSNFFYTVTLPCTLWFFDKAKIRTSRKDKVLFMDARHLFRQVDRAHRDFTDEQTEFIANIARLYRGEQPEFQTGSETMLKTKFRALKYEDVAGLCKVSTIKNIEAQGWSLNPGRYIGVTERAPDEFNSRVSEETAKRLGQHRLKKGDIVYGRRGDIGRQALITGREGGWLCGTGCLRLSLGDTVIDPEFLHYYLCDEAVIKWIANQAIGATLPNLNTAILRSVLVRFPRLKLQREIARTLSAYNELIENNTDQPNSSCCDRRLSVPNTSI
jgi:hypothetical protein